MGAILPIVENACALLVKNTITANSLSIPVSSINTGIDNDEKTLPEVICYAEDAKQKYRGIDWWDVKTNIIVAHRANRENRAKATSEANTIFDAFYQENAATVLSNITSSFVCAEILDKTYSNAFEQDSWIQMATFTMLVCPSGSISN